MSTAISFSPSRASISLSSPDWSSTRVGRQFLDARVHAETLSESTWPIPTRWSGLADKPRRPRPGPAHWSWKPRALGAGTKGALDERPPGLERVARMTGLEPATSGVTGRHSNQLSYIPARVGGRRVASWHGVSMRELRKNRGGVPASASATRGPAGRPRASPRRARPPAPWDPRDRCVLERTSSTPPPSVRRTLATPLRQGRDRGGAAARRRSCAGSPHTHTHIRFPKPSRKRPPGREGRRRARRRAVGPTLGVPRGGGGATAGDASTTLASSNASTPYRRVEPRC